MNASPRSTPPFTLQPGPEPHAFALYRLDAALHGESLVESIALGQSLGAWEQRFVPEDVLRAKVAKVTSLETRDGFLWAELAFPLNLWHGKLDWLLTLLFGKMSFYPGVQLASLRFSPDTFGRSDSSLAGPTWRMDALRELVGCEARSPLLMGILKPNVGMTAEAIATAYSEVAEAGLHLVKDDEIRHDPDDTLTLERVERVAGLAARNRLRTLYAVHFQSNPAESLAARVARFENAGAQALLVNVWTGGLGFLQTLRTLTRLPILAHPALAGAFADGALQGALHPRVALAQLVRAAGADLSLFPSPYGKPGLTSEDAREVARACLTTDVGWPCLPTLPVPSAGLKPEHGPKARSDFGTDFVMNAGTAIFTGTEATPASRVRAFFEGLGTRPSETTGNPP